MLLLVVEDDPRISSFLCRGLRDEGYSCLDVPDLAGARSVLQTEPVDAVILDLTLPDGDGLGLLEEIRREDQQLPVLILSAQGSESRSRVLGLEAGADDYLPKPFDFEELIARLRSLLRRGRAAALDLRAGPMVLDVRSRTVRGPDGEVALSPREFALLEYFFRRPNEVLSRARLEAGAWPSDAQAQSNVVDVYVGYLRRKVAWPSGIELETVPRWGYRLRIA